MDGNTIPQGSREATGIAVEGGGLRGIYAAGVLDEMYEAGITFDAMAGVSAGAIHCTSFKACQPGRGIRFYLAFSKDPRFMGFRSWLLTGDFINRTFCYVDLPERLVPLDHDAYETSKVKLYITCSDVETGKPYYHLSQSLRGTEMDILRASASLPIISRMVEYNGHKLLDGGATDSIPVTFLRDKGYTRTVVILTQVAGYLKQPQDTRLIKLLYRKYPNFVHAMEERHTSYNATLKEIGRLESQGEIFVYRPSRKVDIKRLERNPATILEMYELGRSDARQKMKALREFLAPK